MKRDDIQLKVDPISAFSWLGVIGIATSLMLLLLSVLM